MNFISFNVEAAESCGLLYMSNQKAWHPVHTSKATGGPSRASSVMSVIALVQLGQFMGSWRRSLCTVHRKAAGKLYTVVVN